MRLFSYKITRDFGFAPNPFHGICTLATCKPNIRSSANVGDIIVGCGSTANQLPGHVICALRVTEKCTFQEYWEDERFRSKRPYFRGGIAQAYGDNIYHRGRDGEWIQERSHHSYADGSLNPLNLDRDTGRSEMVLLSEDFAYFGRQAKKIPQHLRNLDGYDLYPNVRDYLCNFPQRFVQAVDLWFSSLPKGCIGLPAAW